MDGGHARAETDPWRVDSLKARDTYLLETRSVVVRQFFAGKKALQQTTPFRLEAGLGATLHGEVETHLETPQVRTLLASVDRLPYCSVKSMRRNRSEKRQCEYRHIQLARPKGDEGRFQKCR
jgi:hypothetical protein